VTVKDSIREKLVNILTVTTYLMEVPVNPGDEDMAWRAVLCIVIFPRNAPFYVVSAYQNQAVYLVVRNV